MSEEKLKSGRTRNFFHEVRQEMKKVTWPTRGEVYGSTAVIIAVTFALCVMLAAVDGALAIVISQLFRI